MHRKESKNIYPKTNIPRSDVFRKKYKNFLDSVKAVVIALHNLIYSLIDSFDYFTLNPFKYQARIFKLIFNTKVSIVYQSLTRYSG